MEEPKEQGHLEELHELIKSISTAMFTTRRPDGRLVARPMATQKRNAIADLWFVTEVESEKVNELKQDPHVSLSYFDTGSWEWVSVSGTARVSTDRAAIRELYQPDWKAWFESLDEVRNGGPDDPRLALLLVDAESAIYLKREKSKPRVLFEVARGMITGEQPEIGKTRALRLDEDAAEGAHAP